MPGRVHHQLETLVLASGRLECHVVNMGIWCPTGFSWTPAIAVSTNSAVWSQGGRILFSKEGYDIKQYPQIIHFLSLMYLLQDLPP